MANVTLADAKARLSELVDRAAAGEDVLITRRGKLVARIVSAASPARKPIDVEALRALSESMPPQAQSAAEFIRAMRDDERY